MTTQRALKPSRAGLRVLRHLRPYGREFWILVGDTGMNYRNLGHALDALERRGLVTNDDGLYELTDAGCAALDATYKVCDYSRVDR